MARLEALSCVNSRPGRALTVRPNGIGPSKCLKAECGQPSVLAPRILASRPPGDPSDIEWRGKEHHEVALDKRAPIVRFGGVGVAASLGESRSCKFRLQQG